MRVSLFVTCLTDTFFPRAGMAVVKVLERLGCEVDFPQGQTCCGQPMFNNGFTHEARELAKRMIAVFEHSQYVVTPSGSCAAMIHDYYLDLLRGDHAWEHAARAFVGKTHEFGGFVTNILKPDLRAMGARWPGRLTYHYSCHLRGIGVNPPPVAPTGGSAVDPNPTLRLLDQVEGLEYLPLERAEQCCGFGGTFAAKMPAVSGAMVRDKVGCIRATGAAVVMSNEGGCTMNIEGACRRENLDVRFITLAELLAESLGLMGETLT